MNADITNIGGEYTVVQSITIYPDSILLNIGETAQLETVVYPSFLEMEVDWESDNLNVATVDEKGLITAISHETCQIIATLGEASATCQVTVETPVIEAEQIIMNFDSVKLNIGKTLQLEATVLPENTTDKTLIWSSSDESVASVSETGLVFAVTVGTATITATCREVSANCEITVISPIIDAEQIVLNLESAELNIGETVQLEATVLPEDTTDKFLSWNSSDPNVAFVSDDGLVTGVSAGSTIITAICGEVSAECIVTVLDDSGVESLFANPESEISIYSPDGILIKKDCKVEELKTLTKGIYIIVSGKEHYKISI